MTFIPEPPRLTRFYGAAAVQYAIDAQRLAEIKRRTAKAAKKVAIAQAGSIKRLLLHPGL